MDSPFTTDYAKSSRAVCRGCQSKICKETLRLAIMLQSSTFDGKVPNWYHSVCFFSEHMPKSITDISNYNSLRWEDRKNIESIIEKGEVTVDDDTAKNVIKVEESKATKDKFSINYSKTSQCECFICKNKIKKGEVQIVLKLTKPYRYHLLCFSLNRSTIGYLEEGTELAGYDTLEEEDQEIVKTNITNLSDTLVPKKKQRLSDEVRNQEEETIKNDVTLLHEYRNQLKSQLTKQQLEKLLKHNRQKIPKGIESILDRASEMLTYGSLGKCPDCRRGQLYHTNSGYKCTGFSGPWGKCTAVFQNVITNPVMVPEELKILFPFLMVYDYVPRRREENVVEKRKKNNDGPLNYLNFVILGFPPDTESEVCTRIKKLGGRVVSRVKRSVLAVVTTREELERSGSQITEAKHCQIYVVSKDFITAIINTMSQDTVLEIIRKYDMSDWGAELNMRIPPQFRKENQSNTTHNFEGEESRRKIKVKRGLAIEPDSGLDSIAHVYQQDNERYTAVLSRTDIGQNKNTYYKIQLLEADNEASYWVYRSWGRIGTSSGSNKVDPMPSLEDAIIEFQRVFKEKTGNSWSNRRNMVKKPGLFTYIEVDYAATKEEIQDLEEHVAESKLEPAVAHLIAVIFNVASMEKLMLEYSLDTQKMPLGKLSKYQIKKAYSVLTEAITLLNYKSSNRTSIVHISNMFYSLMPFSSAQQSPQLLDNLNIIKNKLEMLESLYEMETAYTMIQRNASGEEGNPLDALYKQLCTDLVVLNRSDGVYSIIEQYVTNTHADTHRQYNLQILEVFEVNRHEEPERYNKYNNLHNRKLLWHGSRTTNYAGILSQGLRIAPAEAPSAGAMFGKGVYFADMVSKSANYCGISAVGTETEGLLLLCEVALGNMSEKYHATNVKKLPRDMHSVKGVGQTEPDPQCDVILPDGVTVPIGRPVMNIDMNSSLLYNEYIVYDIAQVKVRYLLKMRFRYTK